MNTNKKTSIGMFSLTNSGAFAVKLEFEYLSDSNWVKGSGSGFYDNGTTETLNPGESGCPDGSVVRLLVDVAAGNDNLGMEQFIYKGGNSSTASYVISGTTMDNKLAYNGLITNK